jgi:trans-aconitate methyltransferase
MTDAGKPWDPKLYEGKHSFVWKAAQDLLGQLAARKGERVLDLGCGPGQLTSAIAESGAEVVGLDNSPTMIEQARKNYPSLRFEIGDGAAFRVDAPFDAVFSNAALHWMTRPTEVASRVFEALKPGGRFVAEMGGKGNVHAIHTAITRVVRKAGRVAVSESSLLYFPSLGEYARVLENAGLRVTYAVHFDRPTRLEGDDQGLRHWISMFADRFIAPVSDDPNVYEDALREIEAELRPRLHHGGAWHADYVRLRVTAVRPGADPVPAR